jgi:hypothetical protein
MHVGKHGSRTHGTELYEDVENDSSDDTKRTLTLSESMTYQLTGLRQRLDMSGFHLLQVQNLGDLAPGNLDKSLHREEISQTSTHTIIFMNHTTS